MKRVLYWRYRRQDSPLFVPLMCAHHFAEEVNIVPRLPCKLITNCPHFRYNRIFIVHVYSSINSSGVQIIGIPNPSLLFSVMILRMMNALAI